MRGYNRLEQIVDYLKSHNLITVDKLVAVTSAPPVTIRRDLVKLDEQGVISHTHDGAALNRFIPAQLTTHEKMQRNLTEKHAVTSTTASMAKAGDSVVLGAGATMIRLARQTTHLPPCVITSGLHIALFSAKFKQIEVTVIGGRIDDSSQFCTGEHGHKLLQDTWPDVALLSCNSWDLEKDIAVPAEEKAALKHDLIAHASRKILLADNSKYSSWLSFNIAHLDGLIEIIMDSQLDGQTRRTLASLSTRLIIAD